MERNPEQERSGTASATIVLPTYRRPDRLTRVLRGLAEQVDPGVTWDLVVVDNDAPSATIKEIVASIAPDVPAPVQLVNEERLGVSHARNTGVAHAVGSIVVFIDDDVRPETTWLRELLAPVLAGRCEAAGGRVLVDPSVPRPWWYTQEFDWHLAELDFGDEEREIVLGYVVTANAAFRLDVFRAAGGFDPGLGPSLGVQLFNEDVALSRKFVAAGGRIRYVPSALVIHDLPAERLAVRYMFRRFYSQGRSDFMLEASEADVERPSGFLGLLRRTAYHLRMRFRAAALRSPVWSGCQVAWAFGFMSEYFRARTGTARMAGST